MTALFAIAGAALFAAASPEPPSVADCPSAMSWPHWNQYVESFVSPDGRVIDRSAADRSTSEGQAYALFFSLVADDQRLFDRILRWTGDNLAAGDLVRNLPAWNWGRDRQGRWGVVDANPASDADLWLAYALLEAGRLWSEPRYAELARRVVDNVVSRELADLPALGPMILPAPRGFVLDRGHAWRLNPSYLPPQILRRLAAAGLPGPWRAVLDNSIRMLRATAVHGVVADWVLYSAARGFGDDPLRGPIGSYDAIRNYLWVGMLSPADPARAALERTTGGLLRLWIERGRLPEMIDVRSLRGRGDPPVGFYAALLPQARARAEARAEAALEERVATSLRSGLYGERPTYYDQNLILFARGFVEGRFRFDADGRLVPAWRERCVAR